MKTIIGEYSKKNYDHNKEANDTESKENPNFHIFFLLSGHQTHANQAKQLIRTFGIELNF
jgi:hypothetical protein